MILGIGYFYNYKINLDPPLKLHFSFVYMFHSKIILYKFIPLQKNMRIIVLYSLENNHKYELKPLLNLKPFFHTNNYKLYCCQMSYDSMDNYECASKSFNLTYVKFHLIFDRFQYS